MKQSSITSKSSQALASQFKQHLMPNYGEPWHALVKGKGSFVWDAEGRKFLDFTSGIAVNTLGHCHPAMQKAIRDQAKTLLHVSNLYATLPQGALAEKLSSISLGGKIFFANSGAEANEGLIKLARKWGTDQGRYEIITMNKSFHGRTLATLTATGQEKVKTGFYPLPEGFVSVDFGDLAAVEDAIHEKTVAVMIEPIQGEGGVIPAEKEYLQGLRDLCTRKGILLLFDEIQCGAGRTGAWYAYQKYGVQPDALSSAKGLGGGLPIGAVIASPRLSDVLGPGSHGSTFGGNPIVCAGALAVLRTIEQENLLDNATAMGELLEQFFDPIVKRYDFIHGFRGMGLMRAIVVDGCAKELGAAFTEKGLLTIPSGPDVVRLLPPLNVTQAEMKKACKMMDKAIRVFAKTQKV